MTAMRRLRGSAPARRGWVAALALCGWACTARPEAPVDRSAEATARAATARGDWSAAARLWNELLVAGGGPEPYLETARALWNLRDEETAQALLDRGIALHPEDPGLHMLRGKLLRKRGFRRAAELDFSEVTELAPEDAEAWLELGRVLLELDLPVRAALCLEHHLKLAGPNPEASFLLGRSCAESGELAAAVESFDTSLGDTATVTRLVSAAGAVADERHADECAPYAERALAWVDRALEIDPQNAEASYVRGCLLEILRRDADALAAHERAVELDNFHLLAMTRAAELYARMGDVQRADRMIDRALDLNIASSRRRTLERLRESWH